MTAAAQDGPVQPVTRMVWRLTELPRPAGPHPRLAGMRVLLIGGEQDVAAGVERALKEHGALVRRGPDGPGPVDAIVDLTVGRPYGPDPAASAGVWRRALTETVTALRGAYDDWAAETAADRLFYLAVSYLGGGMGQHPRDGLEQPLGGIWAGLAKTLHREFPNVGARVVDIDLAASAELPGIVAAELGRTGEIEVGYRDGRRFTLTPEARPVAAPALTLGPEDTVLISGGGRGIGWELARSLAARHGARVVVTGREPFPSGDEPWFGADEAGWKRYEKDVWAGRAKGESPALIRGRLARTRRLWELARHMTGARREGLRVEYARCDVTDRAQVRELIRRVTGPAGGRLAGVVHNAGVDTAARLPKKTDEEILRTVEVKIEGFLNVFEAVRDRDLKFFCSVGSLTGRLGGMVGQLEYAAANDGLARLGQWAARRAAFPVMTLAWPTWDRIGLIANFAAALRYMAAIDVADGLERWRAELLGASEGEVTFVGPLGRAIDPGQAVGYPVVPALPGFATAYPKIFHLGEVTAYQPHAHLAARVVLDPERTPALGDFRIDGAPALPPSLLLENALRAAEWLVPEDFPELRADRLEEIVVPLSLLRLDGPAIRLVREARGFHDGHDWIVEVRYRHEGAGDGAEASLRIVHQTGGPRPPAPPRPAVRQTTTLRSGPPFLLWRGAVVPVSGWTPGDRPVAEVPRCPPADLWATPLVPGTALPVGALENVVRHGTTQGDGLSATADPLVIGRIAVHSAERGPTRVEGDPSLGVWRITDAHSGDPVATVSGFPGPLGNTTE
ncbi:SDR family NAD(P)-dependent oxidoreductase [Streptomyces luomodiensis]|uniref:SDR family NAD(P)-dependent oxidoreductase n=1 Tax=Streptomyces luomodiensis TaxID=3026192 RepID=A0ABY9VAS2_9ACTN|nr:SDR family NAD(P)-dependent oxidoreductase [Streptomyces sp. SCA4-21]WNE99805.1 SDR family NAD(P)-dependent oxidoreductase [Streptomyces sp. SCA4-21]